MGVSLPTPVRKQSAIPEGMLAPYTHALVASFACSEKPMALSTFAFTLKETVLEEWQHSKYRRDSMRWKLPNKDDPHSTMCGLFEGFALLRGVKVEALRLVSGCVRDFGWSKSKRSQKPKRTRKRHERARSSPKSEVCSHGPPRPPSHRLPPPRPAFSRRCFSSASFLARSAACAASRRAASVEGHPTNRCHSLQRS